jgi:Mn2+/Fe2+ NRAMP family transporter
MATAPAETRDELTYPPPSPEISGGWLPLLKVFGPGAIIASVTVGTGETIFAPRMGALFGYTMFWVVLTAVIAKGLLRVAAVRHLVLAGEHPVSLGALPGAARLGAGAHRRGRGPPFPMWIAALSDAVGSICIWVTGVGAGQWWGRPFWGGAVILATMALTLVQTYDVLERVSFGFLALKILFVLAACLVVKPDWLQALFGLLPRLPDYPAWATAAYPELSSRPPILEIATLLGTVGGGVQDYLGYVGCAREKRWGAAAETSGGPDRMPLGAEQVRRGRAWLRAPAFDVVSSFLAVFVMTGLFMLLGAALLHPQPRRADQRGPLRQAGAVPGRRAPRAGARLQGGHLLRHAGGRLRLLRGVRAHALRARPRALAAPRVEPAGLRFWNTLYCGLRRLVLLWTGLRTVTVVTIVSPFSGVLGCGLWCLAMLWVDRGQTPAPYRMGAGLRTAMLVAGAAMAAAGLYTTYASWLG